MSSQHRQTLPPPTTTTTPQSTSSPFHHQRDALISEIALSLEHVLQNINKLNRSLEGVIAVGNEFGNVEGLWSVFEGVMARDGGTAGGGGGAREEEEEGEEGDDDGDDGGGEGEEEIDVQQVSGGAGRGGG